MSYIDLLFDITDEDEKTNEFLSKAYERYIDQNNSIDPANIKVKAYKTVDELDDVESMKLLGYEPKEIDHYKKSHLAIFIFVKE